MNGFAALSPYLIPDSMPGKRVNIGDGFILRGIERQVGSFVPGTVLSSRIPPTSDEYKVLLKAGRVILAGANQLDDNFSVWPGLMADDLAKMPIEFIPFGVGMNGVASRNRGFTENALATLRLIHERVEFSSWRCPITVKLIEDALPELKGRALMTGCPVLYDRPLIEGSKFHDSEATVAVTVTERDDFWDREAGTLRYVAARFKRSRRTMVLHQVFDEPTQFELRFGRVPGAKLFLRRRAHLRILARELGFTILSPKSIDDAVRLYEDADLHIGSRLHAHLMFLSRNKRSLLTYVDDRMRGFSQYLGFPLSTTQTFDRDMNFDFEVVRNSAISTLSSMRKFVNSIGAAGL